MDSVELISEQLANQFILKEAAEAALADMGIIKLSAASWMAPLVGTGLGAVGGGLAGYLSSPEIEDAKQTRKRMLIGALTGGGLGGAAGLGLNALNTTGKELDREALIRQKHMDAEKIVDRPDALSLATHGVMTPQSAKDLGLFGGVPAGHPVLGTAALAAGGLSDKPDVAPEKGVAGIKGKGKPALREGLPGVARWAGEQLENSDTGIGKALQSEKTRLTGRKLMAGNDEVTQAIAGGATGEASSLKGVQSAVAKLKADIANEAEAWQRGKGTMSRLLPREQGKPARDAAETARDMQTMTGGLASGSNPPFVNPVRDERLKNMLGKANPNEPVLWNRIDPSLPADKRALIKEDVIKTMNAGGNHSAANPVYWKARGMDPLASRPTGAKPKLLERMGKMSPQEEAAINRLYQRLGMSPMEVRKATSHLPTGTRLPGLMSGGSRTLLRGLAATLLGVPAAVGEATYDWQMPGMRMVGGRNPK